MTLAPRSWAVLRTGGKQYRVAVGDIIRIEWARLFDAVPPDDQGRRVFSFGDVLAVSTDGNLVAGSPCVTGARIVVELLAPDRADKVIVFKKGRRKNRRRKAGHRQRIQPIRVMTIEPGVAVDRFHLPSADAYESRVDLSRDLSRLAENASSDELVTRIAARIAATNWAEWDLSDRKAAFEAISAYRDRSWDPAGAAVDGAISRLKGAGLVRSELALAHESRYPEVPTGVVPDTYRPPQWAERDYCIDLKLSRQGYDRDRFAAHANGLRVVVQGTLVRPDGSRDTPGQRRYRPQFDVRFSGRGIVPDTSRAAFRLGGPPGVAARFVASVGIDPDARDEITMTLLVDRHPVRRFLDPVTLRASSAPARLCRTASDAPREPMGDRRIQAAPAAASPKAMGA